MATRIRSMAFWGVVVLFGLPLLYILSFGPACWWFSEKLAPNVSVVPRFYAPLGTVLRSISHGAVIQPVTWYATLKSPMVVFIDPQEPGNNLALLREGTNPWDPRIAKGPAGEDLSEE